MHIRQGHRSDSTELAVLILSSAPDTLQTIFHIDSELSPLNFLSSCLTHGEGQYGYLNHWVAEDNNKIVGCMCTWHHNLPKSFHTATLQKLTQFYGLEHSLAIINNSQVMGDCIPPPKSNELCVGHFAVAKEYRRQGWGEKLLEKALQLAIHMNKSHLSLDVEANNQVALDFYQNQGFVKVGESEVSVRMANLGIGQHWHLTRIVDA